MLAPSVKAKNHRLFADDTIIIIMGEASSI